MSTQVIRNGDRVRFKFLHAGADGNREYKVVDVGADGRCNLLSLDGSEASALADFTKSGGPRSVSIRVSVHAICHANSVEDGAPTEIMATYGFLGNIEHWCWWEVHDPEAGSIGPYASVVSGKSGLDAIKADLMRIEREDPAIHFHLSVFDTVYGDGNVPDKTVHGVLLKRRYSSPDDSPAIRLAESPFAQPMPASLTDARRFFELVHVEEGATEQLRITLVGSDPHHDACDHVVVELLHKDTLGNPNWREVGEGSRFYEHAVYCLLRRLIEVADRHEVLAHLGVAYVSRRAGATPPRIVLRPEDVPARIVRPAAGTP